LISVLAWTAETTARGGPARSLTPDERSSLNVPLNNEDAMPLSAPQITCVVLSLLTRVVTLPARRHGTGRWRSTDGTVAEREEELYFSMRTAPTVGGSEASFITQGNQGIDPGRAAGR
jgi:hypothetical protein